MRILYIGLSPKVFGTAETIHQSGHAVHFIKPGERKSRESIALAILEAKPIDLIVVAEIHGDCTAAPQAVDVLQTISQQYPSIPILGISNPVHGKVSSAFLKAGAHVSLPLLYKERDKEVFRVASVEWLLSQIESLARFNATIFQNRTKIAMQQNVNVSQTGSLYSFYDFSVNLASKYKRISFRGQELEIGRVNALLFAALLTQHSSGNLLTRENIYRTISEWGARTKESDIAQRMRAMQRSLNYALALAGYTIDFPLVRTGPKSGWALVEENLARLAGIREEKTDLKQPDFFEYSNIDDTDLLQFRGLIVHLEPKNVTFCGYALTLTDTERNLMEQLVMARGERVRGRLLHERIWGEDSLVKLDVVSNHFANINAKLPPQMHSMGLPPDCVRIETNYSQRLAHFRLVVNGVGLG